MNLATTASKRSGILVLLAMAAFGVCVQGATVPVDPFVGTWLWNHDQAVTIDADGTAHAGRNWNGTWQYLHNTEVQRHYRIVWEHGANVEDLACSEDGKRAHVRNQKGEQYNVRRALDDKPAASPATSPPHLAATTQPAAASAGPADPIIGEWGWLKGKSVTFLADGTLISAGKHGTWEFLHNPEPARKYRVVLSPGGYTSDFLYDPVAQTARATNTAGRFFDVGKKDATAAPPVTPAPGPIQASTTKSADPGDPIVTEWHWGGAKATFLADGSIITSTGGTGTWEFQHNPEVERKYRVVWSDGKSTVDLTYQPTTQTCRAVNNRGKEFDVTKWSAASPKNDSDKPAGYFGAPAG